jgi:hypothetical protein
MGAIVWYGPRAKAELCDQGGARSRANLRRRVVVEIAMLKIIRMDTRRSRPVALGVESPKRSRVSAGCHAPIVQRIDVQPAA